MPSKVVGIVYILQPIFVTQNSSVYGSTLKGFSLIYIQTDKNVVSRNKGNTAQFIIGTFQSIEQYNSWYVSMPNCKCSNKAKWLALQQT